jgi:hypothetical protein
MTVNTALNNRLNGEAKAEFIILAFASETEKNKIIFFTPTVIRTEDLPNMSQALRIQPTFSVWERNPQA